MLMPWSIGKCFYLSFVSARALLAIAPVPPTHALSPAFANYQHDLKIVRSCLCRGTLASSSKYSLTSAPRLARLASAPCLHSQLFESHQVIITPDVACPESLLIGK